MTITTYEITTDTIYIQSVCSVFIFALQVSHIWSSDSQFFVLFYFFKS